MNLLFFSPLLIASMVSATGSAHYGGVPVSSPIKKVISPPLNCRTEYVTLWDTSYQETEEDVCVTVYEKECQTHLQRLCQPTTRQECHIEYNQHCETVYKNVCVEKLSTEYEPFTETECSTLYKEECQHEWQGEGNDKVWVPIAGTCQNLPVDECKEVTKTHAKQVTQQVCHDVPEQKCVKVPNQVCVTVPDQVCTNEPLTKCKDVPRQECHSEHKRIPIRVSRQQAKKTCNTDGTHFPDNSIHTSVVAQDNNVVLPNAVGVDERNFAVAAVDPAVAAVEFDTEAVDLRENEEEASSKFQVNGSSITFSD